MSIQVIRNEVGEPIGTEHVYPDEPHEPDDWEVERAEARAWAQLDRMTAENRPETAGDRVDTPPMIQAIMLALSDGDPSAELELTLHFQLAEFARTMLGRECTALVSWPSRRNPDWQENVHGEQYKVGVTATFEDEFGWGVEISTDTIDAQGRVYGSSGRAEVVRMD